MPRLDVGSTVPELVSDPRSGSLHIFLYGNYRPARDPALLYSFSHSDRPARFANASDRAAVPGVQAQPLHFGAQYDRDSVQKEKKSIDFVHFRSPSLDDYCGGSDVQH